MAKKYRILRVVATGLQVIGWLVVILGTLGGLTFCVFSVLTGGATATAFQDPNVAGLAGAMGVFGGLVGAFFAILYSVFIGFLLIAAGQLYYVIMDIEENTRALRQDRLP